jgi:hypothetical protein
MEINTIQGGGMSNDQQNKEQLIESVSGQGEAAFRRALDELRKRGWLRDGSLKGIYLCEVDLKEEDLWGANLQEVNLSRANLQDANLQGCALEGTILDGANLQGVVFRSSYLGLATFSDDTILPDGTQWVRGIDLARFTDPNHANFWRSADPKSPAYRRNGDE